ncbi:hypothetical protein GCM10009092_37450 [Bowmanella denitrificans]|uniref:Cytochrome c domain-containing protein n=2 Tax=Bowmanella denitrificans TaxID=366582 RepID=A0ABN0XQ00_9ALTE
MPYPQAGEPQVMLDIGEQLGEVEVENGLLGFDFHPRFGSDNQFVYLYYTDTRPQDKQVNRLSRFDLSLVDVEARSDSQYVLLAMDRTDDGFHNGGEVAFGPDGYLYIGLGEGVHPKIAKTSQETLRGGILRIDVDMSSKRSAPPSVPFIHGISQGYWIPKDNPFSSDDRVMDEYFALGLRNPFRFSFDPNGDAIWVGDVGSTIWEEINRVKKGKHYQFPQVEGNHPSGQQPWETLGLEEQGPVYTYEHTAYDRAVIGGVVNQGDLYPGLENHYIFADNYSAKIFSMPSDQERVEQVTLLARANQFAQRGVSSIAQLASGEILVTTLGAASDASGDVLRLVSADKADVEEPVTEKSSTDTEGYDEKIAASLYSVNCARCHGIKGDGNGPDAKMLNVDKMPDFTSPLYHFNRSEQEIRDVIKKGGAAMGMSPMMPPWGGFLKDDEVDQLTRYLQSLPEKHHVH